MAHFNIAAVKCRALLDNAAKQQASPQIRQSSDQRHCAVFFAMQKSPADARLLLLLFYVTLEAESR